MDLLKGIRRSFTLIACAIVATLFVVSGANAADSVGKIKVLTGQAVVVRGQDKIPVALGMDLVQGDRIETKEKSSVGILFADDTRVSLAANSAITIDKFVYDKETQDGNFITNLLKGTLAFLTGKMGKANPENVKIKTPLATIGIRGTKFVVTTDI